MSRINPGAAGGSSVSRARSTAEPKIERSAPRTEAREPATSPKQFRDEFVGGTKAKSGNPKSSIADTARPLAAQRGGPSVHSPGKDNLVQDKNLPNPADVVKGVVETIRGVFDRIFGGGNGNGGNGGGPVVQSPGKDQLAQGPGTGGAAIG